MFGYREDEVLGQSLRLIIAPSHHDELHRPRASALEPAERGRRHPDEPAETMGRRKDGSCFPMEMGMSQMQIGERRFTIGSIRDITGRKQRAERERRREQALLGDAQRDRVAFEEAPIGSVITSSDGRIERVNQAVCRMTGHTLCGADRPAVLGARPSRGPAHDRSRARRAAGRRRGHAALRGRATCAPEGA